MNMEDLIELTFTAFIKDWQLGKEVVYPIIRTKKENEEEYRDWPSSAFLDLKVYYILRLTLSDFMMATVNVTNDILEGWGITKAELHKTAMHNMAKDGYEIREMMSVCRGILGVEEDNDMMDLKADMYVLTNKSKKEGASGILHLQLIKEFAEKRGMDLYILPSSIHETILIPFNKKICPEMLKAMVVEINESQVEEKEQLGNSIYAFSRKSGKIYIAL